MSPHAVKSLGRRKITPWWDGCSARSGLWGGVDGKLGVDPVAVAAPGGVLAPAADGHGAQGAVKVFAMEGDDLGQGHLSVLAPDL